MDNRLTQLSSLSQKDKAPAFLTVLSDTFADTKSANFAPDLHTLVDTVVNQDSVGLVIGRQVISELVKSLSEGAVQDPELKKQILQDTLDIVQPRLVSYEEQVSVLLTHARAVSNIRQINSLRFQLADLFEQEEDWSEAAKILMGLSLDSGQRYALPKIRLSFQ
jgi:COP9 signalosome complex subunit 4